MVVCRRCWLFTSKWKIPMRYKIFSLRHVIGATFLFWIVYTEVERSLFKHTNTTLVLPSFPYSAFHSYGMLLFNSELSLNKQSAKHPLSYLVFVFG